ncbi:uncharacterized protein LOC130109148 [Lampris incognitus]|uniref:uncharacterized protein LOC130109148 n=1 Tax=Lampris incognitus TaxID=2546036 RepID=UPI0024B4BE8D|nr:uncharacterized protein LOC130109148 [Lampris incognitus]
MTPVCSSLFRSDAAVSEKASEGWLKAQKITNSITYYYTTIPATEDQSSWSAKNDLSPGALSLTSCPSSCLPCATASGSDTPRPSPLTVPSTPLITGLHSPTSISQPSDPPSASPSSPRRPLVLLLPWLGAQPGAVAKYRDLYMKHGMDVLVVESGVVHFLWPRWGLEYALEVLKVLEGPPFSGRPVLVHACSIGAYTFSQMLIHMAQGPEKYAGLVQRVVGSIYDSVVIGTLDHMATGVGKTLFPRLETVVRNAALFYFGLFKTHTEDYYNNGIHTFHNCPLTTPALFFFCENDALCDPVAMEATIDLWRERGVAVRSRKWKESVHAAHMRCHRDDYLSTLEAFLKSLPRAPLRQGERKKTARSRE